MPNQADNLRIAFLDIDGVLLPSRARVLPENLRRLGSIVASVSANLPRSERYPVDFDPVAVALVNRLCELSDARIVIHSDWRRVSKRNWLHQHLIGQGILPAHLHEHWFALMSGLTSTKAIDIHTWISKHRPDSFVVIDDEPLERFATEALSERLVLVDGTEGFLLRDYAKALDFLETEDPELVAEHSQRIQRRAASEISQA
jgi:HAD domain in Swiss Army Knife RNA repair proteins